jgi:hypothetical protein
MVFGWLRSRGSDSGLHGWRQAWREAVEDPSADAIARLTVELDALGLPEDDVEIEREMLEGLEAARALAAAMGAGLPAVETGHKAVGADACHFTAPASRTDDLAQPAGRLFLTSRRAMFVGGPGALTIPWHAVADVRHAGRDLVVLRRDRDAIHQFRCNTYADVLCGRLIARRLVAAHRPTPRV